MEGGTPLAERRRWEPLLSIVKIVNGQTKLLEMIRTLRLSCRFAGSLNRRQKKSDQYADDRNDDEKLNESKGKSAQTTPPN